MRLDGPERYHLTFDSRALKEVLGPSGQQTFTGRAAGRTRKLSLIKRLVRHPRCEVLVTFMYEEINRFLSQKDQPANLDGLLVPRTGVTPYSLMGLENERSSSTHCTSVSWRSKQEYHSSTPLR